MRTGLSQGTISQPATPASPVSEPAVLAKATVPLWPGATAARVTGVTAKVAMVSPPSTRITSPAERVTGPMGTVPVLVSVIDPRRESGSAATTGMQF